MIHKLSAGIGINFGWEKYNVINIRCGKICENEGSLCFDTGGKFDNEETYKSLGFLLLKGALV